MANIKQQKKRNRRALKQRETNLRYRSTIKTSFKRLMSAVEEDGGDVAERQRSLVKLIDRAAARGAIHSNNAARKKARVERIIASSRTPEPAAR